MNKEYFVTEELDKTIILQTIGGDVNGRIWCVGVKEKDKTHRMREYDGFYNISDLKKITR